MRYIAMQVLTWGTILGASASAVLLAALDVAPPAPPAHALPTLPLEPTQAGRTAPLPGVAPAVQPASAPRLAVR